MAELLTGRTGRIPARPRPGNAINVFNNGNASVITNICFIVDCRPLYSKLHTHTSTHENTHVT